MIGDLLDLLDLLDQRDQRDQRDQHGDAQRLRKPAAKTPVSPTLPYRYQRVALSDLVAEQVRYRSDG